MGRRLTESYGTITCGFGDTEVQYSYDVPIVSCPVGATCSHQQGRLAYVKSIMFCDISQGDWTMDQETFLAYDPQGRLIQEYIRDDSGRTAVQSYAWDKNNNMTQVTMPSGVIAGYTLAGAENSDANLVSTLWRNAGAVTNLLTNIQWLPLGPVSAYDQANTIGGSQLHAALTWNLASRATRIKYNAGATNKTQIDHTEDEKGRYISKVYSNMSSTVPNSYLTYDWFDRLTCDATVSGSCPTSGSTLRSSVSYNASNDRVSTFRHQDPAYGDLAYEIFYNSGTDKLSSYSPGGGTAISYSWDDRGNRTAEDDAGSSIDRRDYTYDGRRRVRTISGTFDSWPGPETAYDVTNAYDHRDRRIYRRFKIPGLSADSVSYFYYDLDDRLSEVKYFPVVGNASYTLFQFYWLGKRPVAYVATDSPSGTVARYFIHADEANRPLEVFTWPTSSDATLVWGVNPDAFGWDRVTTSSISYQPLRMNGAYFEDGTMATRVHIGAQDRPPLLSDHGLTYDPMTETELQAVGAWPNESYALDRHDSRWGLGVPKKQTSQPGRQSYARSRCTARRGLPLDYGVVVAPVTPVTQTIAQQGPGGGPGGGWGGCVDCGVNGEWMEYQEAVAEAGSGPLPPPVAPILSDCRTNWARLWGWRICLSGLYDNGMVGCWTFDQGNCWGTNPGGEPGGGID